MRHLIAIAAAVGIFAAVSAPSFAATTEFAAAAKKPTAAACKKNPKLKGCDAMAPAGDKKSSLTIQFAAATKKVDCKDPKNADNKACKPKAKAKMAPAAAAPAATDKK